MNESHYEIILYWDKGEGFFVAEVPELAGCHGHGPTRADAVESAEEAIALWIETAKEDGVPVPEPRGKLMYA